PFLLLRLNLGLEIVAIHPDSGNLPRKFQHAYLNPNLIRTRMQTLHVNGYDMAYLEVGQGEAGNPPLVCVHGTLGDFRTWYAVLGPLSKKHRVIAVSLRHFSPSIGMASVTTIEWRSTSRT